jgi:GWxTD domain-containing protein
MVALALAIAGRPAASAATSPDRAARAEALARHAEQLLTRNTIDTRRLAIDYLEQAVLVDPANPAHQLALARVYYQAGFLKNARIHFQRVVDLTPNDADGRYGLGLIWRRDWLKFLDRVSLDRSIENYSACVKLSPGYMNGWLALVPLLVEKNDLAGAARAAYAANAAEPRRPEPWLAIAYTAYRLGRVTLADSAFRATIPWLPDNVRARFDDIAPVASERDTMEFNHLTSEKQLDFLRRFWRDLDPDLASPENEAQLEYWARVAHAYFLFYDQRHQRWDERGEIYVRYGPPSRTDYNPVNMSLYGWKGSPVNLLLWEYPDLGMKVVMEDRLLTENYMLPLSLTRDTDPRAEPDAASLRDTLLASHDGRGAFHRLPPGVEPIPVRGAIARFETEKGSTLLGEIETPGSPGDSLSAEWVVMDSSRVERARGWRLLSPSACEATERQAAQFAIELPPGHYVAGLTVRDAKGRRGVFRADADLESVAASLALSDVVVVCGNPDVAVADANRTVRIEPNPSARVDADDPLVAYFEIYHLNVGAEGRARFQYQYTVRSAEKDSRFWVQRILSPRKSPPAISASREEENVGPLRRQFLSVPVSSLPAGKYRLEVRVRDLVSGEETERVAEFLKTAPPQLRN